MYDPIKYAYDILLEEVDNDNFNEFLSSTDYDAIRLIKFKEAKLLKLLDQYEFKGSLKSALLFYCSKLIPLFDKDSNKLKEVSIDDLNAQREYWDNMVENLQVRMNNASSHAKERLRPMIKAAINQREKLKALKGTKQKPINTHLKTIPTTKFITGLCRKSSGKNWRGGFNCLV